MQLKAEKTPYSSVVGGGLKLVDDAGRVRFMVMVCGIFDGITKEEDHAICSQIAEMINAKTIDVPERT